MGEGSRGRKFWSGSGTSTGERGHPSNLPRPGPACPRVRRAWGVDSGSGVVGQCHESCRRMMLAAVDGSRRANANWRPGEGGSVPWRGWRGHSVPSCKMHLVNCCFCWSRWGGCIQNKRKFVSRAESRETRAGAAGKGTWQEDAAIAAAGSVGRIELPPHHRPLSRGERGDVAMNATGL